MEEAGVYRVRIRWPSGRETESLATWTGDFWRFTRHSPRDYSLRIDGRAEIVKVINFVRKEES